MKAGIGCINPDGKLDLTFGTNGAVSASIGEDSIAEKVRITDDGKILVFGNSDGNDIQLRYNPNGTLDARLK